MMPTFNRARYLVDAVDSVLAQTVRDLELVVIDDGSTDETPALVAAAAARDARVQYTRQPNQGLAAARNHGLRLARGDYLAFLDSDDEYLPTALEDHLAVFAHQPGLGMAIGGYEYVDESGTPLGRRCPWQERGTLALRDWLFNCYAMPGAVVIRRAWLERAGPFDGNALGANDWDMFLRLAQLGCPMDWTRETVCRYRQHSGGMTREVAQQRDGALRALEKVFAKPDLEPEIAALEGRARAWVYVVYARQAYDHGQTGQAEQDLRQALRLDPNLAGGRKAELLEYWLGDRPHRQAPHQGQAGGFGLPPELRVTPADIRRADARLEMARFFAALQRRDDGAALPHFQAGLKLDPRWLANRGVLAFGLRLIARRPRQGAAP
jgi:hypothetical protein